MFSNPSPDMATSIKTQTNRRLVTRKEYLHTTATQDDDGDDSSSSTTTTVKKRKDSDDECEPGRFAVKQKGKKQKKQKKSAVNKKVAVVNKRPASVNKKSAAVNKIKKKEKQSLIVTLSLSPRNLRTIFPVPTKKKSSSPPTFETIPDLRGDGEMTLAELKAKRVKEVERLAYKGKQVPVGGWNAKRKRDGDVLNEDLEEEEEEPIRGVGGKRRRS